MTKEIPFDDDIMTLIMGITPEEPGPHGRMHMPKPSGDAVSLVTQIRDLCDEFLMKCGKHDEEEGEKKQKPAFGGKPEKDGGPEPSPEDKEETEEEE